MINFLVGIILGALVGWIASLIVNNNNRRELISNSVAGILGACIAGYLVNPTLNAYAIDRSPGSSALWVSLGGAVMLLTIFKMVRTARTFLNQRIFFSLF